MHPDGMDDNAGDDVLCGDEIRQLASDQIVLRNTPRCKCDRRHTEKLCLYAMPKSPEPFTEHRVPDNPNGSPLYVVKRITLGNCMGLGERPYIPPWWGQLAWFKLFAAMLLLAVLGNTLIIWIVLAYRRMRTVTNCFLANLAVVDLLMATLNGAPNFIFLVTAHWPFGSVTCTASNFTANLTVSAGVLTLVAKTVDRYGPLVKPLQHRLSRSMARAASFTVWFASVLLALPSLLYSDSYTKKYVNGEL